MKGDRMPYTPTWNSPYMNPYLPQYNQGYPVQAPVNGITKVNGRDSAMQYQLPPNSMSPALFDVDGRTFYVVSTDGAGAKTVEAFDYLPHIEEPPPAPSSQGISREEFDALAAKVADMEARNGIHGPVQTAGPDAVLEADGGEQARGDQKRGKR